MLSIIIGQGFMDFFTFYPSCPPVYSLSQTVSSWRVEMLYETQGAQQREPVGLALTPVLLPCPWTSGL